VHRNGMPGLAGMRGAADKYRETEQQGAA